MSVSTMLILTCQYQHVSINRHVRWLLSYGHDHCKSCRESMWAPKAIKDCIPFIDMMRLQSPLQFIWDSQKNTNFEISSNIYQKMLGTMQGIQTQLGAIVADDSIDVAPTLKCYK
jgi:hypothetical protein